MFSLFHWWGGAIRLPALPPRFSSNNSSSACLWIPSFVSAWLCPLALYNANLLSLKSNVVFSLPLASRFQVNAVNIHWTPGLISIWSHCEQLPVCHSFTAYWLRSRWPAGCHPSPCVRASWYQTGPVFETPSPCTSDSRRSESHSTFSLLVEPRQLCQGYANLDGLLYNFHFQELQEFLQIDSASSKSTSGISYRSSSDYCLRAYA